jgi:hypothetical protein
MEHLKEVPTTTAQLTREDAKNLGNLREGLENAQYIGDLFAEWHAATDLANYLWALSASYDIEHFRHELGDSLGDGAKK